MHARQAEALAARGFRVIRYDRRGTGASTRADRPGGGADQHADDAAALLRELDAVPATVLRFSSGGVVGMLPDGPALGRALQEPADRHLQEHPGDWTGAYHVLLDSLSDGRADHGAPVVRAAERNAEAILRDDGPFIVPRAFTAGELPAEKVVIAVSEIPDPLNGAIADRIAALVGREPVRVPGAHDHEVHLDRPEVLAEFLAARRGPAVSRA